MVLIGIISSRLLERSWRNYMITCLFEGMKRFIIKPINYEKLLKDWMRTWHFFQSHLVNAVRKYTNLDPTSPESITILAMHFVG